MRLSAISILPACLICLALICCSTVASAEGDDSDDSGFSYSEEQFDSDIPIVEGHGGTITFPVEDDVLLLNDDNFDHAIATKDNLLVYFFAPWCGHCKSLGPEFAKAAGVLATEGAAVHLGKVDATVYDKIAARFEVSGYPTLFFFKKGKPFDYDGPRDALGIVQYLKQRLDPDWKPPPSNVLTLTSDNFTSIVKKSPLILVKFYTQWCTHCKKLVPDYERASAELMEFGIPLAKVDGATEVDLKHQNNVTEWPTLKIFRNGRAYEYKGPRETRGIVKYMKEENVPASKECTGLQQLENSFDKLAATVIGFFVNSKIDIFQEYIATTYYMRGQFTFLHTFDKNTFDYFKVKSGSILVLQPEIFKSKYEKSKHEFSKDGATSEEIAAFVRNSVLPLVGHRHRSNLVSLYDKHPQVVVYYDVNFGMQYRKATQIVRQKVLEVAKDYPDIVFAVSDEETFHDELKELGLDDSGEDVNVGYYGDNGLRYPMEPVEDFELDDLRTFIKKVQSGKIEPFLRSQPIPKSNDGPVKVVVAKSFQDIVINGGKNVLIEFYAPWCGHCKALEPEYLKLAKQFENYENLIIAKMDASANDVIPPFKIDGYPSIYFVKAGDEKNPIAYDGADRNVKTLSKFINKHLNAFENLSSLDDAEENVKDEL